MKTTFDVIGCVADLVTIGLGILGLWGLIARRRQISTFLRLTVLAYRQQRLHRVRTTLERLRHLNYEDRESRPEIRALLGQLCGELKSLSEDLPGLRPSHERLAAKIDSSFRWTELEKRRLLSEIDGACDQWLFSEQSEHQESMRDE